MSYLAFSSIQKQTSVVKPQTFNRLRRAVSVNSVIYGSCLFRDYIMILFAVLIVAIDC